MTTGLSGGAFGEVAGGAEGLEIGHDGFAAEGEWDNMIAVEGGAGVCEGAVATVGAFEAIAEQDVEAHGG